MFIGLINNAGLLIMLAFVYDMLPVFMPGHRRRTLKYQLITGISVAMICLAIMYAPWELMPGVVFDMRSVAISVTGLYYGALPSLIVVLVTSLFRLLQGGSGVAPGIATILLSAFLGLAWRYWRRRHNQRLRDVRAWELLAFGLVVHIGVILCMFTLPLETALKVIQQISLPFLTIHPLAVMLMGSMLTRRIARTHIDEALRQEKLLAQQYFETAAVMMMALDTNGVVTRINRKGCEILGYPPEAIVGKDWCQNFLPPAIQQDVAQLLQHIIRGERKNFDYGENPIQTSSGEQRIIAWHNTLLHHADGTTSGILVSGEDITQRKQVEQERKIMLDLLHLINSDNDYHGLMHRLLIYLQECSQCEAVGIRLRDGEDYPYYEATGFPDRFLRTENRLCSYKRDGTIERDEAGIPILECMCGNILRERFNPEMPFFTGQGSFWTNSTTKLLAETSEADRQARTRNRCNGEGYESVALIPLRAGGQTLGLIQFNDHQPGRFSPETIALFERLADNIANSIARQQAQKDLRASQERFRALYEYSSAPILEEDFSGVKQYLDSLSAGGVTDFSTYFAAHPEDVVLCSQLVRVLDANQAAVRFFEAADKQALLTNLGQYIADDSWDSFQNELVALAEGQTIYHCEISNRTITGAHKILSLDLAVVPGYEDTLGQVLVSFWDMTERERTRSLIETSLKEKETLLRELYHRTKNNMQLIGSMLVLQSADSDIPAVHSLVLETKNKIQAMSLLHELLYQSQDLSSIDLSDYIERLVALARSTHYPISERVALHMQLESIAVTIDTATPLGLVLNEMLSNAYKHAFPNGEPGEINICLQHCENHCVCLSFSDNGIGVPSDFDLRHQNSYGLLTVFSILEHQMGGKVSISTQQGVSYHIEFPEMLYQRRL